MVAGIISGILAGYVAAKLTKGEGMGCLANLFIGIIGGLFGDWFFSFLGMTWHIQHPWFGAVAGAILVLWLWNKFFK